MELKEDFLRYNYQRIKVRGPDGVARYTAGNKDSIAKSLFGMSKDQLLKVALDNGLAQMRDHYKLRNDGHFRMIVGQALRNIIIKGKTIQIGEMVIHSFDQKVNWPKGYREEQKGTHRDPIRKGVPLNRIDA